LHKVYVQLHIQLFEYYTVILLAANHSQLEQK